MIFGTRLSDTVQGALGLELWSMTDDIVFDNFLIADSLDVANDYAADSWDIKSSEERASSSAGVSLQVFL